MTINQSIFKSMFECLRGATKSHDFHPISNYRRVIDCQVLMEPTLKWSINYSLPNVKLCKRFHLSSQTEIENSFPWGPPVDPESLNGRKWKNKRKEMSSISILKRVHIFGGKVFLYICPVQSNACESCVVVVVVCLFICRRRHQSETKLVSENNIQSVHIKYISRLYLFAMPLFCDRRGMRCVRASVTASHFPSLVLAEWMLECLGNKCAWYSTGWP